MGIDTTLVYMLLYMALYFEVFLLISFIAHKKNGADQKGKIAVLNDNDMPSTTVIVPCYNEEKTLAGTLHSLLALDYPAGKLAIAVVNDGSTDNTSTIARDFANKYTNITTLDKDNGGKASAMNVALAHCKTELIGCLDADSFVDSGALRHIARHFVEDDNVSAVTPAIMIHEPKNILQYMQRAEYMVGVFMRRVFSMIDSIVVTPGPFSIFRTSDILEISTDGTNAWKHAHGTEDFEMGLRLQSRHKCIANEPLARVLTISPDSLYSLYRQRIRWVYGFLMNAWDYKYMVGNVRYGNVGIFVLPTAIVSVFGAVLMFGIFILNIITSAFELLIKVYTVGVSFSWPRLELFYINTNAMLILMFVLVAMILVILHNSAKMSETPVYKKDTAMYIMLYGLVAPLWLTGAVARALVGAESKWKVIR